MPFCIHPTESTQGYGWATAKCDQCEYEVHIAVGFQYDQLTIENKIRCALKMGWQVAPSLICPRCIYKKSHPEITT